MLALLLISIAGFFALFFAMLTLLRHAATTGRIAHRTNRQSRSIGNPPESSLGPHPRHAVVTFPAFRSKRPDWRFLVRDGRRPFPSGQIIPSARKPPTPMPTPDDPSRSDWAHYNKHLGDLNDPYQVPASTARRA